MRSAMTPALGLTGGTGTGKSTLAKFLGRRGARLIDADKVGHVVLETNTKVRSALEDAFGTSIFGENGTIDRKKLGDLVFGDAAALARLNAIVHPPLLEQLREELNRARLDAALPLVVVDAALIAEWGIMDWFDALVVVTAPRGIVEARLAAKGLGPEAIARRISSQLPDEERIKDAAMVVQNDGDLVRLEEVAGQIWDLFARPVPPVQASASGGTDATQN
ncbi:MAG TPA: dephospho-CoA kinase [Candidatus Latescibacteria bacterium]|nr:dephospho-CoA kinase [Candidatus Latescibacterota bacterium]